MRNSLILFIVVACISFIGLRLSELDPGYTKAFGYGSICVSSNGYPGYSKYDESQFDYHDGKFFVSQGGQINLRAILPKNTTYGKLLKEFTKSCGNYKDVVEDNIYWKIYASHDLGGVELYKEWPKDPEKMLHNNNPRCFMRFALKGETLNWDGSGVDCEDTESNDLKSEVGNWLKNAKPGMQLYIFHTVGFQRKQVENKFWDYSQGKEVIPIAFEMAKPVAYCIVEVK